MADDITSSVVIDSGCGYTKCDTAGEDIQRHIFPTVIGKVNDGMNIESMGESLDPNQIFVGDEALKNRGLLSLSQPMHRGFIHDWEGMEKIWAHCYTSQLKLNPTESPVLTTCPPHEKKSIKEKTAQSFFETLNVPGFYCFVNSLLSLYGSGRTTGVVLDSGEEITTVLPIQEGSVLSHAQVMVDFGGSDLNMFLHKLLQEKNPSLNLDIEQVRNIKEEKCNVAFEYDKELASYDKGTTKSSVYELPDGENFRVQLDKEVIKVPESCFDSGIIGKYTPGLHELVFESIRKCENEVRRELFGNVILSGGNTLLNGFVNRLNKELTVLAPNSIKTKIMSSKDRNSLSWTGGAVVSSLTTFQSMWITRGDYDENGPSIVHRKCL